MLLNTNLFSHKDLKSDMTLSKQEIILVSSNNRRVQMSSKQKMKLIKELLAINPQLTVAQVGKRVNMAEIYFTLRSVNAA